MLANGWKSLVREAIEEATIGNTEKLEMLAAYLEEIDKAKQVFKDKGYGVIGTGLLEMAQEAPPLWR